MAPVANRGAAAPIEIERKLRWRQLTDDRNVEISGRDLREKTPPIDQGRFFETAT